jgi:hypothetical protein
MLCPGDQAFVDSDRLRPPWRIRVSSRCASRKPLTVICSPAMGRRIRPCGLIWPYGQTWFHDSPELVARYNYAEQAKKLPSSQSATLSKGVGMLDCLLELFAVVGSSARCREGLSEIRHIGARGRHRECRTSYADGTPRSNRGSKHERLEERPRGRPLAGCIPGDVLSTGSPAAVGVRAPGAESPPAAEQVSQRDISVFSIYINL